MDVQLVDLIRTVATAGFVIAALLSFWLVTRVLDERRGRQLSALQVLLNPIMIDRQGLTERGRQRHTWYLRTAAVGVACWVVLVLIMLFGP